MAVYVGLLLDYDPVDGEEDEEEEQQQQQHEEQQQQEQERELVCEHVHHFAQTLPPAKVS